MTEPQINFNCLRPGVLALFPGALLLFFFFFASLRLTQLFVAAAHRHMGRGRRQQAFCQDAIIYLYNIFILPAHPLHRRGSVAGRV